MNVSNTNQKTTSDFNNQAAAAPGSRRNAPTRTEEKYWFKLAVRSLFSLRDNTARLRVRSALARRVVSLATSTTREGVNDREYVEKKIPIAGPTSK